MKDSYFNEIASLTTLPPATAREFLTAGFVVIPRLIPPDRMPKLAAAYDAVMQLGTGPDFKIASTTTRLNDFVNLGPAFDEVYIHAPLLEACQLIIGEPFKLSSLLGRTLRAGSPSQKLHVDLPRDSSDLPMVGFILMIDDFTPDNGATRFIPTSQNWPNVPSNDGFNTRSYSSGEALACGHAGSMVIFNASIWHGDTANITSEPRRSIQGYFVRRGAQSGTDFSSRMRPETLDRIIPLARYLLSI